jgi:hypothetical protein
MKFPIFCRAEAAVLCFFRRDARTVVVASTSLFIMRLHAEKRARTGPGGWWTSVCVGIVQPRGGAEVDSLTW